MKKKTDKRRKINRLKIWVFFWSTTKKWFFTVFYENSFFGFLDPFNLKILIFLRFCCRYFFQADEIKLIEVIYRNYCLKTTLHERSSRYSEKPVRKKFFILFINSKSNKEKLFEINLIKIIMQPWCKYSNSNNMI